jgi:hypothetical protein
MKFKLLKIATGLLALTLSLNGFTQDKKIQKDAEKYAKQKTKEYEKQGWMTKPGPSIKEMMVEEYIMRQEKNGGGSNPQDRYMYALGNAVAGAWAAAVKQAVANAREDIITQINSNIEGYITTQIANSQISLDDAATVNEMVASFKTTAKGMLNNSKTVVNLFKENDGKTVEVSVMVFFDVAKQAKELIIQNLKNKFKNEPEKANQEIKKLQEASTPATR